jgi:hypothetical protein
VVDGVLRACHATGVAGEVINVATGGRVSLNELLRMMNGIVGTDLQPIYQTSRTGDVRDSQADIRKASARLGYCPTVSCDVGLQKTLDWYREAAAAGELRAIGGRGAGGRRMTSVRSGRRFAEHFARIRSSGSQRGRRGPRRYPRAANVRVRARRSCACQAMQPVPDVGGAKWGTGCNIILIP